MSTTLNHKPTVVPPVICDFGWTYSVSHQRLPEYTYQIGTSSYPPGMTVVGAVGGGSLALPAASILTGASSLSALQAAFPVAGTITLLHNDSTPTTVHYTGLATTGGGPSFTGCTGGTGTVLAGAAIYDARYYVDSMPLLAIIRFDATDGAADSSASKGLPVTIAPVGVTILSYHWDFGNGLIGSGPQASTTYPYSGPSSSIQATLTVLDSLGRRQSCAHSLKLLTFSYMWGTSERFDSERRVDLAASIRPTGLLTPHKN